jgi:hypothetical protein
VNPATEEERGIGAGFPGPVARSLLRLLLPADRREEFEGDLIEEAETIVLPRSGRRVALRWFWWQVAASAPPMLALRLKKEVGMYPQRWIVPAALLVIWGLWGFVDLGDSPNGGFDWDDSVVIGVRTDGPADQAGLREGDRILSLDGIPVGDRETLRRQPRTEIGGIQLLVVERTDEATGLTTTENIEITYSLVPAGERTFDIVGGVIGLVFLLSGMLAFLKAPSTPTLLFAIVGFGFAGIFLPSPYIGSPGLQAFLSNVLFVAFLTAFASLFHLLLIFPKRKRVMEKKNAGKLIYLPVAIFALLGVVRLIPGFPLDNRLGAMIFLGLIFVGYLVLSIVALVHSFVTAAPLERAEEGLNFMLVGVVFGFLPITLMMVSGLFGFQGDFPGSDFLFLTILLIPISFGLALLKGARVSLQPTGTQSA